MTTVTGSTASDRTPPSLSPELEQAIDALAPQSAVGRVLKDFGTQLFGGSASASVEPLDPREAARFVAEAFAFLAERTPLVPKIRVRPLERDPEIGGKSYSTLEILNDDMPFLLDSVLAEIQARGLDVHLVRHPILEMRRDATGKLLELAGAGTHKWPDGSQESFIVVLLPMLDEALAMDLAAVLEKVLAQVRAAVADWQPMLARLNQRIAELEKRPAGVPAGLLDETLAICRWLLDGHFVFLGTREYRLDGDTETGELTAIEGSGLGILKDTDIHVLRRGRDLVALTPEIRRFFFAPQPIIITKSSVMSLVHRRVHMDYIGLKTYAPDGKLAGELRLVGLFTSQAYTQPPQQIPFLRLKVNEVVKALGFVPSSHDAKSLIQILETFPRDELVQIGVKQLTAWAAAILDLELRPRTRLLVRIDRFDRFVSALVYVPRDRFSTKTREKVGHILAAAYGGQVVMFQPVFTEAPLVRVHYIIGHLEGATPAVDVADLEARVVAAVRTWEDGLTDALGARGAAGAALLARYRNAFPGGYTEAFSVQRALDEIGRIERLGPDRPLAVDFYREADAPAYRVRVAISRFDEPIPLSERVPVLENFGFRVIDERSYRLTPTLADGARTVCLHDLVLETSDRSPVELERHHLRLEVCFLAVLGGEADNDPFNKLIISASADWREAAVLRAYAAYLRQIRSPFGPRYIAETLDRHAGMTRDLIELFRLRFDPGRRGMPEENAETETKIRKRYEGALAAVQSLDEDRILRHVLTLISAPVRTNYFRQTASTTASNAAPDTIAFKLASKDVDGMPEPRPYREIWVYSPRVEGIHLRFAPIARGGLRWSDRAQDFRTEVLGLAKAQQVKNAVIVPAGAKGGFVPKRLPRIGSREEIQAEGTAAYKLFVGTLLSITDNLKDGSVVPPPRVVRHEGDDPYLVVAADKGTATFSDIANRLAADAGFWLGDAFASGGSAGYDHKKMGITARGAFECVKRLFREMNRNILEEPFSVVGVGDMSGDVFGNGMLLSRETRLIAAFDHRDIFIDPIPDPAASFEERKRLFDLARSSWQDYDKSKLSAGGGIYPRSAKSVSLSAEARTVLGITAPSVTPADIMRAILKCKADLLWFGGIGTYVRATSETDEQAGDRANDALRVTASEVGAKVMGEGANLAVTQRARIEFAMKGGRINTDFIDNSAGVNSSDQEVNIKIALLPALVSGRLGPQERNSFLAAMTDDVAAACLANNYGQSLAVSLAERAGSSEMGLLVRLMRVLEARGLLERKLEGMPDDAGLEARQSAGKGFERPELAVLMSLAKIALSHDLLATDTPDHPAFAPLLHDYFPPALRERFGDDLAQHRLKREIVATQLTNQMLNRGGLALAVRLEDETGRTPSEIATAYTATARAFGLAAILRGIDALDNKIDGSEQLGLYAAIQDLVLAGTSWFVRSGVSLDKLDEIVAQHAEAIAFVRDNLESVLSAAQLSAVNGKFDRLFDAGVPRELARTIAAADALARAPIVARLAAETGRSLEDAARATFAVAEHLHFDEIKRRARTLRIVDTYDRLAVDGALQSLEAAQRALANAALNGGGGGDANEPATWLSSAKGATRARNGLDEILKAGELTVARLVVAASKVRDLAAG